MDTLEATHSTADAEVAQPAQSAGVDPWSYWRDALASRRGVDTERGNPRNGYYRLKDEAIAFWREDGGVVCWRSGTKYPAPTKDDAVDELFGWCAPHPISFEDFTHFQENGRWPDQIAPVDVDADLPPHERADAELTAQREAMAKWIAEIKAISTQEQATKAGNFADVFAKIEKASEESRKAEKRPHDEAADAVQAKWVPVVKRAADLKTWAKKSTEAFLIAERARIKAEEDARQEAAAEATREAEERRRQAQAAGAPPPAEEPRPLPAPPPEKAKAGKVHLRTETVYEVENPASFLRWLSAQNNLPDDFLAVLKTIGTRMVKAGLAPDGVATKTIERAA